MLREKDNKIRKDQRGFTIVELLIAIAILAIVVAAVCGFILVGSRSYANANSDISVQQEAQLALNQMSDVLIDTTRSVNYVGYDTSGDPVLVLKDSEFGFEPVAKSLIMYNGIPVQKASTTPGADPEITIDKGNGNKHYQLYWDKNEETLYFTELEVKDTDKKAEDIHFPDFADASWVVLAEHVTKFEVDLTQVEEKRVVQMELTFVDGKREYNTSNNVTIRNKVAVNDAEIGPLNRKKTLSVAARDKGVILEPGETYHFSTPKVTGENVTDKTVTWSIVSSGSPSGGTQFTDADNGVLKIAPDEPAGTIEVMIKTNAVDSEGKHAACKVTVHNKRVTTVDLYKSADDGDNKPNEISPGCTFTITANVSGYKLGETCSGCEENPEIDDYVVCEGNPYGNPYVWQIVDPRDLDPPSEWNPFEYLTLLPGSDQYSATFYLSPDTPTDGSYVFVIRAMSLLSTQGNSNNRQYSSWVPGAIELTAVKGKENAKPYGGALKYGTQDLREEIREGLPADHGRYVTCVRVVDNSHQFEDKVLLYYTIGGGNNLRIVPDMFDLDLNGSYTFYVQALDPVSIETRKLKQEGKIDSYIEDSKEDIWKYYWEGVDENTKPYGYNGDRYLHGDVFYATLNKPKLTYHYNGLDYKGTNITYDPVNIYMVGNGQGIVGQIQPKQDGTGYENIVDDNSVWNLITNSLYEGKGDDPSKWNKIYYFNQTKINDYPDKEINEMLPFCYEGTKEFAGKVTVDPKGSMFMKLEDQGNILGACGEYHIVPGMVYQNKRYKESDYEIIGALNFDYYAEHKRRYYQFDDSTIHVKVTSEFTMDINDDQFEGKAMFPLPSQMTGDPIFPNLGSMEWRNSAGELEVEAKRTSNSNGEKLRFDYVRYHYISINHTYEVEPIQIRKSGNKLVIHSLGIYTCEENGTKWHFNKSVADKELNFNVKQFEYNGGQYQTYFPLPTEEEFPFVNGIQQTTYGLSLYDGNLEKKANLSGVNVSCSQTGDTYEIKFTRRVKNQDPDNHKITIISYGTYTWSPEKPEWTKTGKDNEQYDTDLEVNLKELAGKGNGNGKSYKIYFPLPTENGFPFSGTQGEQKDYKPVAYEMTDQYGEWPEKNMSYTVEYKKTGDTYQIEFVDREVPGDSNNHKVTIKSYGAYTWKQGDKEWTKITSQDRFECNLEVNLENLVLNGQSCKMRFPLPQESGFKSMFNASGAVTENIPAIYLSGDIYCGEPKWNYNFGGTIKVQYDLVGTNEHRITFIYQQWGSSTSTSSVFQCKDGDTKWTKVP